MPKAVTSQELDAARASKRPGPFAWADILLAIAAALFGCLLIFESGSFLGFAINADSLHPALAVWDYASHDYAREGFAMSRAAGIFPDLLVYGAIQLATGSWRVASLGFGALSLLGIAIAAGFIVREIAGGSWRTGTQAFLLLTLPILLLELPVTAASAHLLTLLPTYHGGPFIAALAALGVVSSWFQRPARAKLVLLLVLAAADALSDLLFIVSCVGPIAVALGYLVIRRGLAPRATTPVLACLALGTLVGRGLERLLVKDSLFDIDWGLAPTHAQALLASAGELAAAAPLTALLAYAVPIAAFLASPLLFRARSRRPAGFDPVEYWWVLSASSASASLFLMSLVYEDAWSYRYVMPLLWWPIVWTTAAVVRSARRAAIASALAGVTVLLGYAYVSPGLRMPALLGLRHPLEACLLEGQRNAGLKAGLGDYWHARYIEASSDWRLQIDQVESDGSGMWWSNDRFWYTHDIHDGSHPPEYNYIIMPGLDERAIKAHYGTPDRTLDCGGSAVWVYDDAAAFRRALVRNSPALYATFLESGEGIDHICIPADRFAARERGSGPPHAEPREGRIEARIEIPDDGSFRIESPAFGLPAGRWTVALDYSLAAETPGGDRWDIAAGWGHRALFEASLTPTDDDARIARAELDLEAPLRGMEIRAILAGTSKGAIRGAEIARPGLAASDDCAR